MVLGKTLKYSKFVYLSIFFWRFGKSQTSFKEPKIYNFNKTCLNLTCFIAACKRI